MIEVKHISAWISVEAALAAGSPSTPAPLSPTYSLGHADGHEEMADRLTLTRAFEGAGIQSADAERIATEIYDAIHDNVATKADIDNLRNELAIAVRDIKIWAGSIAVIIAGLLFGALHQWPPQPTPPQVTGSPALPGR